ncbi:MAG: HupE/UreJ family protein [Pedosphaera sp.]|nr:HupE/UreJ family protein [Pedosphaera sp.]
MKILIGFWLGILAAQTLCAHKPSDSYLILEINVGVGSTIQGQWDIALRDLEIVLGLDADDDGSITWGEVRNRTNDISALALSRLRLAANGQTLRPEVTEHLIAEHSDGTFAVLRFQAATPMSATNLTVEYHLFFDHDPLHRGLCRFVDGTNTQTAVFSPEAPARDFAVGQPSQAHPLFDFVRDGIHHIWAGYDHILFLLALLLPAVLIQEGQRGGIRYNGGQRPARSFHSALVSVVKVVTAFTVAHSITLSLAALEIVRLPSRWVESAIAISVIVAAINNLRPFFGDRAWSVAFGFGLVHGFGFASVLGDLGLPKSVLVRALLGFNLGVEAGQLTIVLAFLPVAFGLRQTVIYRRGILQGGSVAIALIATAWFVERAFNLGFMPF